MNEPVSMLISFEQTGALMSSFYGKDRTLQFLSAASNLNTYILVYYNTNSSIYCGYNTFAFDLNFS
jgi:hypothetical protein